MDAKTINMLLVGALVLIGFTVFVVRMLRKRPEPSREERVGFGEVYSPVQEPVVQSPPVFVPEKTEAEILQEKRAELASAVDPEDCYNVFSSVEEGSPVETEAHAKAVSLLRAELATTDDIDRCWELVDVMRDFDSDESLNVADEVIEKIFTLTTTTADALSIIEELEYRWSDGIEDETKRALKLALTLAKDYDEASSVFDKAESESDFELEVYKKMLQFTESVEDCESLWDDHGIDTDFGELAILRAAEIIKANEESKSSST